MKKTLLSVVAISLLVSSANAEDISDLESKVDMLTKKLEKLEKKQQRNTKAVSKVNALAAQDNIKFNVDLRTSYDAVSYEATDGKTYENTSGLFSNRLWLGMGYAPTSNMTFIGQLAFNKAFGASYAQRATGAGFDTFDWVINENLTDDTIKLREAYWIWKPTVGGLKTTFSIGRRPSTNGFLANLREDDAKEKSPLGHVINMEFDGGSAAVMLDKYVPGMYFKVCLGRGLTNAASWANNTGMNYITTTTGLDTSDFAGFIFVPYDDGQYRVKTTAYRGMSLPGMSTNGTPTPTDDFMKTMGDEDGAAISFMVNGIGDEINDFLDDTIVFASFATSISHPDDGEAMMGSTDSKTGTSYWIGTQMPNYTGGHFGLEYNHGSKYWRPFTYGEDTMIGSKIAVRGSAYEAYWTQPLVKKGSKDIFSMQVRYTYLDYDFTGSNGFFGDYGTPYEIDSPQAIGMNAVKTAQDIRVYFRYRY
ncbi:DUF3373 family protein [Sulfurimonas sp.]|uniref:DUF3373 family protein n=1 Tax=Sulfurimonas sp. TaxID=2022749 RepID=UPI002608235F|nr:DUF3373 family protein [Sulfurimonas sp.]